MKAITVQSGKKGVLIRKPPIGKLLSLRVCVPCSKRGMVCALHLSQNRMRVVCLRAIELMPVTQRGKASPEDGAIKLEEQGNPCFDCGEGFGRDNRRKEMCHFSPRG